MQTTQDNPSTTSALERRIDMSVPVAHIERDVEQRLKKLARTVRMPGFRPGKVPFKLVAQQYGPQARSEAVGEAVQKAFGDAVRERNLRVAGYPRIEPKQAEDAGQLQFSAVFEVYPEVALGDVSAKHIERAMLTVGEPEVDKTIEVLRKQRMLFVPADRSAADGDRVVVDFTGRIDEIVFQGGHATDFPIVLGAGTMLPDFESQLRGVSAGASKSFDLTFPADYHAKDLASKTATFEVLVKRIEVPQLPELNEDFARALGIADGDLGKMRSEVRANLEREVKKRLGARMKDQVMRLILEVNPIEVPLALVQAEARQLVANAKEDLKNRGMGPNRVPVETAWFMEQASRRVRLGLVMAEMVKEKGLQARPEQVRALVQEMAASYENPAEVVRWYYSQPQQLAQVEALVIEQNVVDWVLSNAGVSDKQIAFDELMGTGA
jgi:trigger factor